MWDLACQRSVRPQMLAGKPATGVPHISCSACGPPMVYSSNSSEKPCFYVKCGYLGCAQCARFHVGARYLLRFFSRIRLIRLYHVAINTLAGLARCYTKQSWSKALRCRYESAVRTPASTTLRRKMVNGCMACSTGSELSEPSHPGPPSETRLCL